MEAGADKADKSACLTSNFRQNMDALTFISSSLHAIAWPAVAICVVLILRRDIAALLGRLSAVKHKETELQFERQLAEAAEKAEEEHAAGTEFLLTPEAKKALAILEISPRSAVVAAWVEFEAAARSVVDPRKGDQKRPVTTRDLVAELLKRRLIFASDAEFLKILQKVRNAALHNPEVEIDAGTAYKVVTVLLRLAWEIRSDDRK